MQAKEKIGKILCDAIPRELLLNFERLYLSALERALEIGESMDPGHRASVVGHNRHFGLNESLMHALDECGISRNPLRGNGILSGKVGIATLARVHMNRGKWDNSRRSKAKVSLCKPNRKVASTVQLDWLEPAEPVVADITAFLVTQGDGTQANPAEVYVAVPDETMDFRNPIFVEPINIFMQRYQQEQKVLDDARPTLKVGVKPVKDIEAETEKP